MSKMKNVADIYPLTPTQTGMMFHTIQAPNSGVYITQFCSKIKGDFDRQAFQAACEKVVHHHPILRTIFLWEGVEKPLQVVRQTVDLPWYEHDWKLLSDETQSAKLQAFLQADRLKGIDLRQAPLMRFNLFMLSEDEIQLVWTIHHLLGDGWSTPLIWRDIFACYQDPHHQIPPSRPYRDYLAWLQKQDQDQAQVFWQQHLQGFAIPNKLPMLTEKSASDQANYQHVSLSLSTELTAQLKALAKQHRITLNTVTQAAWAILLSRYTGEQDIVFGTTVSGRPASLPKVEEIIGLFINTLPLRTVISEQTTVTDLLQAVQSQHLEAREYEYSALADIQRWSDIEAGQSLFDTLLVFENYPAVEKTMPTSQQAFQITEAHALEQSNYPLSLLVLPDQQIRLQAIYDQARLSEAAVTRLVGHLQVLLKAIADNPVQQVIDLPILTAAEEKQLLIDWNQTATDTPQVALIHHLIEAQATQKSDDIAVVSGEETLTYQVLNDRADQLAAYLRHQGVEPNDLVGLCVERSLDMIVGIVGILKAGGAYVPLDPSYPQERLAFMLEDTQASVLLTQEKLQSILPETTATIVCLDSEWANISQTEKPATHPETTAGDYAYVIYTSGSTGRPKGAPITHQNLVHSTTTRFTYYPEPVGRFLLLSSIAFDSSIVGLFWTLCQGGTLVLAPQSGEQDVVNIAALIEQHNVSHMLCLPTLYSLILTYSQEAQLGSLNTVIVAGEACPQHLVTMHYRRLPQATLYNEYGPTEGTVWSSVYAIPADFADTNESQVPIGRPIPNMRAYILDANLHPVPVGVPGELVIGGAGLINGYLNRPDLTEDRFIPHTFANGLTERLYKTGDLASYSEDGNIRFLGRTDHQIKLRGYRIELSEIEAVLHAHDDISDAVVVAHETVADPTLEDLNIDDPIGLNDALLKLDDVEADQLLLELEAQS
ncbi:MAG: amino acid adenylation domain-containing protein [Chloroflexota bacterium]